MPAVEDQRIGYVLKMYPRLSETFIVTEILAHEAAGLDVDIFSLRAPIDGRFHGSLADVKARATYVPSEKVKGEVFWEALSRARHLPGGQDLLTLCEGETAADIHQAILIAESAIERQLTHLHAHFGTAATSVARLAALLAGIPYSFTAHAKDIFHESVEEDDMRAKIRDAQAVITVSDFNLRFLRNQFGSDAERVHRIYNGLDLREFPYRASTDRSPTIIAVGRLVEKKGFGDLIDACDLLRDQGRPFHCRIIGDGALRPDLETHIDRLNLHEHVTMVGPLSRCAVIEEICAAAVIAVPCIVGRDGNRDGLPTVLLEAMALGTPCVATDVTGIPEIVRHEDTGLLGVPGDTQELADALGRILDDQGLANQLAANARRLIENEFDIHHNTISARCLFNGNAERTMQGA